MALLYDCDISQLVVLYQVFTEVFVLFSLSANHIRMSKKEVL